MIKLDFTRQEYEDICYKAMLNDELKQIFEYKILGYSITKISMVMNMSEPTVNRRIKELKRKIKKIL